MLLLNHYYIKIIFHNISYHFNKKTKFLNNFHWKINLNLIFHFLKQLSQCIFNIISLSLIDNIYRQYHIWHYYLAKYYKIFYNYQVLLKIDYFCNDKNLINNNH